MEKLEQAIVDWITCHNDNALLRDQLRQAKVARRDYLRTGYFVYYDIPDSLPLLPDRARLSCPDISSPQLLHGAGTSLFVRNGKVHYLEVYARGGFFPENLTNFRLSEPQ